MNKKEVCKNCKFFQEAEDKGDLEMYGRDGLCRVDAPKVDNEMNGQWPTVYDTDWCGKWETNK